MGQFFEKLGSILSYRLDTLDVIYDVVSSGKKCFDPLGPAQARFPRLELRELAQLLEHQRLEDHLDPEAGFHQRPWAVPDRGLQFIEKVEDR